MRKIYAVTIISVLCLIAGILLAALHGEMVTATVFIATALCLAYISRKEHENIVRNMRQLDRSLDYMRRKIALTQNEELRLARDKCEKKTDEEATGN